MKIFLTGATGVMGSCGLNELLKERNNDGTDITVLARPSKVNRKKLAPYIDNGVTVIWGDLLNYDDVAKGVNSSDIVLHVGGMVSPAADWFPEKTYRVNTGAMDNIIRAAKKSEEAGKDVKIVYIGSVSQYGNRAYPHQWGRTGDPINTATFDKYALSKCVAERMLAESGLKYWVSLRQTGIMYPGILMKASDPITFHVPMATGLEWATDEASGRLLAALCREDIPEGFWNNFYNIGGGEKYRYNNYDFVSLTLGTLGCPKPEKVFELNWFATQNFHGMYYTDSDVLEDMFHFRGPLSFEEYLNKLKRRLPFYFKLAPLAPGFLMKIVMKKVAEKKDLGPLYWIQNRIMPRIDAAFGSMEEYEEIPDWKGMKLPDLKVIGESLYHGYDEKKDFNLLTYGELKKAAAFRGGKCLGDMDDSDIISPDVHLEWECHEGHKFRLTPRTVLKGGHWCPECLKEINENPHALKHQAEHNSFLRQIL